jgi:CRP/FNR family transcriptional regulator
VLDTTTAPTAARDTHRGITPRAAEGRVRCHACPLAAHCLPAALGPAAAQRFEQAVQRCRRLAPGEHLFRVGDAFHALFAVESGCFKTYTVDAAGREHVLAFHFAGEIVGVDAICPERHASSCVALGASRACVVPYAPLTRLAREMPELQEQLLRMLSRHVLGTATMAGDFSAAERLAGFLVMVAARLRRKGEPRADLDLAMSRQDIANYLRLAPETVSRILARFQKAGLVKADRKRIALLDADGLAGLAACMNPYGRGG